MWIDALAGGGIIGNPVAPAVAAMVAFAAGVSTKPAPLATAGVASAGLLSVADQVYEPGRFGLASDGIFYCVIVLAPALLGFLIGSRNRQVNELVDRRRALQILRTAAVAAARAEERERIERRIDLSLADRLQCIAQESSRAHRFAGADPARVPACLEAVEQIAREALTELRELLGFLQRVDVHGSDGPSTVPPNVPAPIRMPRVRALDVIDIALFLAAAPLAIETVLPDHHGAAAANIILSLAQGAALVLTRRWPLPGTVVLLSVAMLQSAAFAPLPPTVSWLLPGLLAPFLIGYRLARWWACAGLIIMCTGTVLITLVTPPAYRSTAGIVPGLVMGLLSWVGGRMLRAREERARELSSIGDELDRTRAHAAFVASAEQRTEMARDLHDAGAHALTVVCLQAGAARTWWDRDRDQAQVALDALMFVTDGTLTQVGRSLNGLAHRTPLGQLDPVALDVLAGIGQALGLQVDITVAGELTRTGDALAQAVYLIVREALTNTARHATGAAVRVHITCSATALEVRVNDTGPAVAPDTRVDAVTGSGFGLRGMRERVEALRGELTAGPSEHGFEIVARLPS